MMSNLWISQFFNKKRFEDRSMKSKQLIRESVHDFVVA